MVRVLIVDEVRLICNVIAAALKDTPDIEVVGYATAVGEALAQAENSDVVLVSTTLPHNGAFEITQALKSNPSVKVVVLGLAESESAILRYIEAGAAGYVLKEDSVDELLKTLDAVQGGKMLISPGIAATLMARVAEMKELATQSGTELYAPQDLSARELEVLRLIAQGLTNQEIAERLTIELGTVKNHVHSILQKLEVSSREDAAQYLSLIEESSN